MTLTRADFVGVMKNAISGLGLEPDAAMVTFPIELFLPGSDIAPVEARKREFYDGLTRWTSDLAGDAGGRSPWSPSAGRRSRTPWSGRTI